MQKYNLLPKLCEFSNCLKRWSNRKSTLMGKITVVKTFALPKLIYPFTVLADPSKQILNKLILKYFHSYGIQNQTKLKELDYIKIIKMEVLD